MKTLETVLKAIFVYIWITRNSNLPFSRSDKCFHDLQWPLNSKADFFGHLYEMQTAAHRGHSQAGTGVGRREPKINFVEVRTFLHLYRSFDRMWIFFILALQAMIILAWSSFGHVGVFFDADVFRNVMTIFITYAILNFLRATLDIILTWNALRSMKFTQLLQYILKFVIAAVWIVVLSVCYSSSPQNPSGLKKFTHVVVLYMLPNMVAAILFFLPSLRRTLERSNMRIITILTWWAQVSNTCIYLFIFCGNICTNASGINLCISF
ncbi:Callose synthase 7, partial [Mucuna pruriens]